MGQHRLFYVDRNVADGVVNRSLNNRPNQVNSDRVVSPVLCLVCKTPSAILVPGNPTEGPTRLAKTMIRITSKTNPEKAYVHQHPCLDELVRNWANYIVQDQGLKALGKKNDNNSDS